MDNRWVKDEFISKILISCFLSPVVEAGIWSDQVKPQAAQAQFGWYKS